LDNQLCISCGEGALKILEIQRPGKKIQQTKDFLLGFTIPQNTQLN